ncbi:hypothetical protein EVAR_64538_1 [Eumeta japonica]|uniref:Uncharacterized protein n=1 Tax=Eumeta variegata TaxID=151549 RepID=A0A4C1ZWG4_EUMVA|nr:hypothetical protein EVAR_64538_1 [Eumeta japonica]
MKFGKAVRYDRVSSEMLRGNGGTRSPFCSKVKVPLSQTAPPWPLISNQLAVRRDRDISETKRSSRWALAWILRAIIRECQPLVNTDINSVHTSSEQIRKKKAIFFNRPFTLRRLPWRIWRVADFAEALPSLRCSSAQPHPPDILVYCTA